MPVSHLPGSSSPAGRTRYRFFLAAPHQPALGTRWRGGVEHLERQVIEVRVLGAPEPRLVDGDIILSQTLVTTAVQLDRVAVHEFDLKNAAECLRISTTQLARFLQQSPLAWEWVNAQRKALGLRPLR